MKRYAIVSMDVEDWYHCDYFLGAASMDQSYHMLDGLDILIDILQKNQIPGTFFLISELLEHVKEQVLQLDRSGSEISCHGHSHIRPVMLSTEAFEEQIGQAKRDIEAVIGHEIMGYRAPTFGIDDERLQIIRKLGFQYDSSKNALSQNPRYGHLDTSGFRAAADNIYTDGDFCEFEISTQEFMGYKLPLGGGYLRMLPWAFNKHQLRKYADSGKFYVLYIHPFELSRKKVPVVPECGFLNRIRSTLGRRRVAKKVDKVIKYMKSRGYEFVTFRQLRQIVLEDGRSVGEK